MGITFACGHITYCYDVISQCHEKAHALAVASYVVEELAASGYGRSSSDIRNKNDLDKAIAVYHHIFMSIAAFLFSLTPSDGEKSDAYIL